MVLFLFVNNIMFINEINRTLVLVISSIATIDSNMFQVLARTFTGQKIMFKRIIRITVRIMV
jgi:hypothetical protein